MTLNRNLFTRSTVAAALTVAAVSAAISGAVLAADPQPTPAVEAAAPVAQTAPATQPAPAAAPKLLSLTEIESRLAAQGFRMKEMEVKDKVLEVEGYDAQGGKVELLVDRRNGEILSRKRDD